MKKNGEKTVGKENVTKHWVRSPALLQKCMMGKRTMLPDFQTDITYNTLINCVIISKKEKRFIQHTIRIVVHMCMILYLAKWT